MADATRKQQRATQYETEGNGVNTRGWGAAGCEERELYWM
jgi:hypothetical protein